MNTSGYTTIDINGQIVGLKFGLPAVQQIGEYEKQDHFYQVTNGERGYSVYGIAYIIYAGYVCNQRNKMMPTTLPFEEIVDYVEDSLMDAGGKGAEIQQVFECFNNSRYVAPHKSATPEETPKKKESLTGTKSNRSAMAS